jgi:hypothetical protein
VDDGLSIRRPTLFDGHAERVRDERRRRIAIDRPAHDKPAEGVEDDGAVDLALPCWMLRDFRDPKLVGAISAELTPYAILGSGNVGVERFPR